MGRPYEVNCTVNTSEQINPDNMSITWIGPDGVITNDNSRITVNQTTSNGIHTSTLKFSYISVVDENTSYYCSASIYATGEYKAIPITLSNLMSKSMHSGYMLESCKTLHV